MGPEDTDKNRNFCEFLKINVHRRVNNTFTWRCELQVTILTSNISVHHSDNILNRQTDEKMSLHNLKTNVNSTSFKNNGGKLVDVTYS